MGQLSKPEATEFLGRVLEGRLGKILERYLLRLSPLTDVHVAGDEVCATDLAEWRGLRTRDAFHYGAWISGGAAAAVRRLPGGGICVAVPHAKGAGDGTAGQASPHYARLVIGDGVARGALVAHLYDLGARGFVLAGLERLDNGDAP
jgi:hypothetical protein